MDFRRFVPESATREDLQAAYRYTNVMRRERLPDDPVPPFDLYVTQLRTVPPIVDLSFWAIWEEEEIVGWLEIAVPTTEDNRHLMQILPGVRPEYRRRGLGGGLLGFAAQKAREAGRSLLLSHTLGTVPAGEAFAHRIGAEAALESHRNELPLSDLDPALMRLWIEQAQERALDFEIDLWEGPYPEDRLSDVAELWKLGNSVPLGTMEVEEQHFTPEQIRAMDEALVARRTTRWTYYAREKSTGTLVGFTEIFISPSHSDVLDQGLTAIAPAYRGKGLGRWLKAAMAEKILRELPETRKIVTGNADVNAPMLAINRQMGFRPAATAIVWQMPVEKANEYVASRGDVSILTPR